MLSLSLPIILTLIVLLIATITDVRKREVPDCLSYSFIAASLAAALAKSIIDIDSTFIVNSLLGLAVFWIIANLLYYGKFFAGGDAKLLMGIGAAMGIDWAFLVNLMITGGLYGLLYSFALAIINFRNVKMEFISESNNFFRKRWTHMVAVICLLITFQILANHMFRYPLNNIILYTLILMAILAPILLIFAKSVEKTALIRTIPVGKLTEGDWLVQDIKLDSKTVKATFEGVSKEDLALLKKSVKKVKVKYGLPFVPAFLMAFIAEILFGNLFL